MSFMTKGCLPPRRDQGGHASPTPPGRQTHGDPAAVVSALPRRRFKRQRQGSCSNNGGM